jgi:hypothetical protein
MWGRRALIVRSHPPPDHDASVFMWAALRAKRAAKQRPKPIRRQSGIAHRRGNRAVAEIMLDRSGILTIVGQLVAAGMAQVNEGPHATTR